MGARQSIKQAVRDIGRKHIVVLCIAVALAIIGSLAFRVLLEPILRTSTTLLWSFNAALQFSGSRTTLYRINVEELR
jgi:hypothetical protein